MSASRRALLIALVLAALAFYTLDLGRYLTLAYLQSSQSRFATLYAQHPWSVRAGYFSLYVLITALSLPGAAVLTLAGGGVLGFGWALALVSFASSLGATLAFLAARWVLRAPVQARFGRWLGDINQGLEREGVLYLLSLRLIPVVPFFAINLAMGLTTMPTRTYYWASQLGMLAGTAVYVNAGVQLATLRTLSDVASPALLAAFMLLGLLPLVAKALLAALRRRRVYARWNAVRPKTFDRNLIVIGAGAGGLVTSYLGAALQAKVTLVEARAMGGDCLNHGCVPSKALIRSASLAHQMRHAVRYGFESTASNDVGNARVSFQAVMARVQAIIAAIAPHDSVARYTALGVEVLTGHARIVNPWTVEISAPGQPTHTLTTRSIVIATGAQPTVPDLPGLDAVGYVTSDTLWERFAALDAVPARLLVLGGGPVGCELAQAFARLGAQVTLVEQGPRLLAREDAEVSVLLTASLQADGVRVLTSHQPLRCALRDGHKTLVVQHAQDEEVLAFDELLCAVGRSARLQGFGLEELGIPVGHTLPTNAFLQTAYPNIYAVGDVTGPYQLTHVASHQAWYAAVNALFGVGKRFKVDYRVIPMAVFTDPEIARVGLNEQEALAQGVAFEVTRLELGDLDRQLCDEGPHPTRAGFVKVLTVPGRDRILGVTIAGSHAAELLAEYVLAMRHGLGLNKVLSTIHIYPSLAEANKYVAGAWRRAHAPQRLLPWLQRWHQWRRTL